jgi:starch phosphorylase
VEQVRTGLDAESFKRDFIDNLFFIQAKFPEVATRNDNYMALAYTVRDRLLQRWISTSRTYFKHACRSVAYLSAEYLLGPQLGNNMVNLGIQREVRQAIEELGLDLDQLLEQEEEPGLGNGGLGRLAACFLDSLATLEIPSIAYGIRYEYGIFDQEIRDGWQLEVTDKWLRLGNPWEIARPEIAFEVKFGGRTEAYLDEHGRYRVRWNADQAVKGVAYDTPVLGYRVNTANLLRLWKAQAIESFDFQAFNLGDYYGAVEQKIHSENLSKVLYPNDELMQGKVLRLQQQYFFVCCALQDMIRLHLQRADRLDGLHHKFAVQLNDTHPSIAVAELMRLLIDEHDMDWEPAWKITRQSFAYTNHTLLPEALEKWPVALLQALLPRHLEVIYEINRRFLDKLRRQYPYDDDRVARLSIIEESGERYVRMAHLACVGSFAVNGVSRLHTGLLRKDILQDFHELEPEKFSNKTNGITPRRFLLLSNPRLASLITERIGERWIKQLEDLRRLEPLSLDKAFQERWRKVKRDNKRDLAGIIRERTGADIDPDSLFDIHAKRIHEYKRQHLNLLHVISLYNTIKRNPGIEVTPRTVIFAGKAAPGYRMAKLIIKLIHSVAQVINRDPEVKDHLKVVFFPDYNVKNSQPLLTAADLSEQISLAGKEASGTGNMKLALNGALSIGTLDGANIEIQEQVGADCFFAFGLSAEEVQAWKARSYQPHEIYEQNSRLREALDLIGSGHFSNGDRALFRPLVHSLLHSDEYMCLADYAAYVECQHRIASAYRDQAHWTQMSILNVARMGRFSSDRAIREYCRDIWRVEPVKVSLGTEVGVGEEM